MALSKDEKIEQIISNGDSELIVGDLYGYTYVNMDIDLVAPLGLLTDSDLENMFQTHVVGNED